MSIILRVDVDGAYPKAVYNHLRVAWQLFPALDSLGYLENVKKFLNDLDSRDVKATFFFQPSTLPKKNLAKRILEKGHSVGLHAVQTQNFEKFSNELSKVSRRFDEKILGFSKHGSERKLSRKHDASYVAKKYIHYAKKANLKYFLGNGENPNEGKKIIDGITFFPSAFWLNRNFREDKFSVDWLAEKSANRDIILLLHPHRVIRGMERKNIIAKEYEKAISKVDSFKTIDEVVG